MREEIDSFTTLNALFKGQFILKIMGQLHELTSELEDQQVAPPT